MTILTQCRKRNIAIDIVSQRLAQLDVFIRRLSWYCTYYRPFLFGFRWALHYDMEWWDKTDIESFELVQRELQFPKRFNLLFNKDLVKYYNQRYLTNYVVWVDQVFLSDPDEKKKVKNEKSFTIPEFRKNEFANFVFLVSDKTGYDFSTMAENIKDCEDIL